MTVSEKDLFISKIIEKTGLPVEKITPEIKTDKDYPVGEKFEEGLAEFAGKLADYAKKLDAMIEATPMNFSEMLDASDKAVLDAGITAEELEVAENFYQSIKTLFGNAVDDNVIMPVGVEEFGEGVIMIKFAKVIGGLKDAMKKPGGKAADYIENTPTSAMFVDTTPGEEGFRAFYTKL